MGCFLGCFGGQKKRRRQRRRENVQPRDNKLAQGNTKDDDHLSAKVSMVDEVPKTSVLPITDTCDKAEGKFSPRTTRKRVTFDTNVKTYEHILPDESVNFAEEKEEKYVKSSQTHSSSENSSVTSSSSGSYPSNHRYQNCIESDEDEGDSDLDDIDDDGGGGGLLDEEFYGDDDDGYYEDKPNHHAKEVYTEEIADNGLDVNEMEEKPRVSNACARDRSGYVHSVLNPVENLTQWRAVKSKGRTIPTQPQKENFVSDQEETQASLSLEPRLEALSFNFKPKSGNEGKKSKTQEFSVDASLSTWLSTPEKSESCESKPVRSHDDRPILGALTVAEIKQFSASSSPRKSPSKSPDTPIIGTVGRYWNHSVATKDAGSATSYKGIPNTSSKYREDKKVKWYSTPFETRLERALEGEGAADA